jgi:hypothetical protein
MSILDSLLPIVGGIAGGMFGMPWLGAAVSGGLTALRTHSIGQGLLSGVASWGLGSLVGGAGGSTPTSAPAGTSSNVLGSAGSDAVTGAVSPMGEAPTAASLQATGAVQPTGGGISSVMGAESSNPSASGFLQSAQNNANNFSWDQAQKNLTSGDWWSQHGKIPGIAAGAGLYGLNAMQEQQALADQANALNASSANKLKQQHDQYLAAANQAYAVNPYNSFYQPGSPYMVATGGLIGDAGLYNLRRHMLPEMVRPPHAGTRMSSVYEGSHGFSTGELVGDNGRWEPQEAHGIEGLLKGSGDGMSDHIQAHIEGHTPARLSNDEFVIPADVVSHLGNGSTSAGAKHLYGMMERVRKARTGNPKQGRPIDVEEHLPA